MEEWNEVKNNHVGDEEAIGTPHHLPAIGIGALFVQHGGALWFRLVVKLTELLMSWKWESFEVMTF